MDDGMAAAGIHQNAFPVGLYEGTESPFRKGLGNTGGIVR
jgi:hypothetical protein